MRNIISSKIRIDQEYLNYVFAKIRYVIKRSKIAVNKINYYKVYVIYIFVAY